MNEKKSLRFLVQDLLHFLLLSNSDTNKNVTRQIKNTKFKNFFFQESAEKLVKQNYNIVLFCITTNVKKPCNPYCRAVTGWNISRRSEFLSHWLSGRLHRDAFCRFPFRWIYYCHSSKSIGKETGKMHLCALCGVNVTSNYLFYSQCNLIIAP